MPIRVFGKRFLGTEMEMFNKRNMIGVKYGTARRIPQTICLGIRGVIQGRSLVYFGVVCRDEGEGSTPDFA